MDDMTGMRVLVTGGAGFIGREVVTLLLGQGAQVLVLDNFSTGNWEKITKILDESDICPCDVVSECERIVHQWEPDAVIHLAGQTEIDTSVNEPAQDAATNILGTVRLIEACVDHGVPRMVFASSCAVFGRPPTLLVSESTPLNPLTPYGLSKATAMRYLEWASREHDFEGLSLVFGNVYGPGQGGRPGVVTSMIRSALALRDLRVSGDGSQARDFVFVTDAARALVAAVTRGDAGMYVIGSGQGTAIGDVAGSVVAALKSPVRVELALDWAPGVPHMALDSTRAREALGWEPEVSWERGLLQTINAETLATTPPSE